MRMIVQFIMFQVIVLPVFVVGRPNIPIDSQLVHNMHVKYMTACEKSLYTTCVIKLGTRENLVDKCDPTDIVACLTSHLTAIVCATDDSETLPTIKTLIRSVARRFQRNGRCADDKFLEAIKEHFRVKSVSLYNDLQEIVADDGSAEQGTSGDEADNDGGDDDADNVLLYRGEDNNGTMNILDNSVYALVRKWRARGKHLRLSNKQNWMRMAVFFDEQRHSNLSDQNENMSVQSRRKRKHRPNGRTTRRKNSKDSEGDLNRSWRKLKRDYRDWYKRMRVHRLVE